MSFDTLYEGSLFWRRDTKDKWLKVHGRVVLFNMTKTGELHSVRLQKSKQDNDCLDTITISKELLVVGPVPEKEKSVFHLANGRKEMHLSSDKKENTNEWIEIIKKIADTKKDKKDDDDSTEASAVAPTTDKEQVSTISALNLVTRPGDTPPLASPTRKPVKRRQTTSSSTNPAKTKFRSPILGSIKRPPGRKRFNGEDPKPEGQQQSNISSPVPAKPKKFVGISMAQVRAKQLLEDAQKLRNNKKESIPECENLQKYEKVPWEPIEEIPPLSDNEDEVEEGDSNGLDNTIPEEAEEEGTFIRSGSVSAPEIPKLKQEEDPVCKENTKRLEEIQRKGGLPDLKDFLMPGRTFIKDGKLKVQIVSLRNPQEKSKRKEERHFILFNNLFLHVRKKLFEHDKIEDEFVWPLELVWIDEIGSKVRLVGPSADELTFSNKNEWAQTLNKTLQSHLNKRNKTLRAERQCTSQVRFGNFTFADGAIYKGQWMDGKREGRGIWKYNGTTYNGEWKDDKMEGKGQYTYPTGDCYFGYFSDGKPHGLGSLRFSDNSRFIGNWAQGVRKGNGQQEYENGDVYRGGWKGDRIQAGELICSNAVRYKGMFLNNLFDGVGVLIDPSETRYEGEFKSGMKFGRGCLEEMSGAIYTGQFENNLRHGVGIYVSADNTKYVGQWAYDIEHGHGRKEYSDGTIYEGEFVEGLRSGKGQCSYPNDAYYEGDWVADKHDGEGEYRDTTGIVYKGSWVGGIKQGMGKYIYPNGATYTGPVIGGQYNGKQGAYIGGEGDAVKKFEGEWLNGAMQGKGIVNMMNGDTYEGHLKNNAFHGEGVLTTASGVVYEGKWEMGVLTGKTTFTLPNNMVIQGTTVSNHLLSSTFRPLNLPPSLYLPLFLVTPMLSQTPKKYV